MISKHDRKRFKELEEEKQASQIQMDDIEVYPVLLLDIGIASSNTVLPPIVFVYKQETFLSKIFVILGQSVE